MVHGRIYLLFSIYMQHRSEEKLLPLNAESISSSVCVICVCPLRMIGIVRNIYSHLYLVVHLLLSLIRTMKMIKLIQLWSPVSSCFMLSNFFIIFTFLFILFSYFHSLFFLPFLFDRLMSFSVFSKSNLNRSREITMCVP